MHEHEDELARRGPSMADAAVRVHAERVEAELGAQDGYWRKHGFTRRRFIAGAGMVGVAALGSQYVTGRAAFGSGSTTGNTVVMIFLRGGCDGLHLLVPASAQLGLNDLLAARPNLAPDSGALLPLTGGWAVHPALAPLMPLWKTNQLAFVPAMSTTSVSRSHFQAQQFWECGGEPTAVKSGWLDRVLETMGPGTTFRAIAEGSSAPQSLAGNANKLVLNGISSFRFPADGPVATKSEQALVSLYRGIDHSLTTEVNQTLGALAQAEKIAAAVPSTGDYGAGSFGSALADLARMIKAGVGLQVATIDVGGFDTHTDEANDLGPVLGLVAKALAGFYADLGAHAGAVTVATMTEFGRRVASNGSGGTDHGHGSVMLLLGGGVAGGQVHGKWAGLAPAVLDQGDVPGVNNAFDVLGEVVSKRLGVGSLSTVFPVHSYAPIGVLGG